MRSLGPQFKYYLTVPGETPTPIFALAYPKAEGHSDVSGAAVLEAGFPLPLFPSYETWLDLIVKKQRCGRCWACIKGAADLDHHNQAVHLTAKAYFPEKILT